MSFMGDFRLSFRDVIKFHSNVDLSLMSCLFVIIIYEQNDHNQSITIYSEDVFASKIDHFIVNCYVH